MSYRVETAVSGRSVCRATECKKNEIKIEKDELRMGTWVEFKERGGWQWKHWGCVTGYQLQNIRNNLEDPERPGVYRWDFLDGYEGGEKGSLDKHPELQEKVRRVITQGFIDPEDFNGDPEMNKLGEKGLHTAETKRKIRQDQINRNREVEESQDQVEDLDDAEKKPTPVVKKESNQDSGIKKATKRKRSSKAIEEEDVDEDADDVKPVKKARAKKPKKEKAPETIKEETTKKETIKEENDDAPAAISASVKRAARVKKGKDPEMIKEEDLDDLDNSARSSGAQPKKSTKKALKEESLEEGNGTDETLESRGTKSKRQSKKGGRGKKSAAPEGSASSRSSRRNAR